MTAIDPTIDPMLPMILPWDGCPSTRIAEGRVPRAALAAARELRRATDRIEAAVVRRARISGLAWAEIATQLGVSKQAVHTKYGRR